MGFSSRPALGVGIDLGGARVRVIAADERGLIHRRMTLPRLDPGSAYTSDEIQSIVGAIRRRGFLEERAEVLVPRSILRSAVLELPSLSSGAPFATIAASQLAHERGGDVGSFEVAVWHPASEGEQPVSATVLSCDHANSEPIVDGFESAGIEISGLRAPESGIAASLVSAGYTGLRAVLDIGWTTATLGVVRDGEVLFSRSLPSLGFGHLAEKLTERLGVSLAEAGRLLSPEIRTRAGVAGQTASLLRPHGLAISTEIGNSVEYVKRSWPGIGSSPVLAVGGGADDSDLTDFLTISSACIVAGVQLEGTQGEVSPRYAAATGAAMISAREALV